MPGGPHRRWGFHRLAPEYAERIVEAARIQSDQLVVDLGAGDGALTEPLLAAGARVLAVELHRGRADRLRARLGERCSVLTLDLSDFRFPGQPHRVLANPPFAHTAELLARLRQERQTFAADLVLPRWCVRRELARKPGRGWRIAEGLVIPPNAFRPTAPTVCSVLQLRRRAR